MSSSISITYQLNPPLDTPPPQALSTSQTLHYRVSDTPAASNKAYYEKLRAEVLQAKSTLGQQLTAWRDAVGKREDNKEAKIPKKSEGADDDEDEDEGADEQE